MAIFFPKYRNFLSIPICTIFCSYIFSYTFEFIFVLEYWSSNNMNALYPLNLYMISEQSPYKGTVIQFVTLLGAYGPYSRVGGWKCKATIYKV